MIFHIGIIINNHTPKSRSSLHFMYGLKHSEHLDFCQTDGTQYEEIACLTSIDITQISKTF